MKTIIAKLLNKWNEKRYDKINPLGSRLVSKKLTYLSKGALASIASEVSKVEKDNVPGIFVEMGCALGGSTIQIGRSKTKERRLQVYDVFGMIPEPSERDQEDIHERYEVIVEGQSKGIAGDKYYGYEENLLDKVKSNLAEFDLSEKDNIHFIKGLYQETLNIDRNVAFAHIDCDWYDSVMTCLEGIEPHLSVGGTMIIDDYYSWSGCKDAVDKYYIGNRKQSASFTKKHGKLVIRKIK